MSQMLPLSDTLTLMSADGVRDYSDDNKPGLKYLKQPSQNGLHLDSSPHNSVESPGPVEYLNNVHGILHGKMSSDRNEQLPVLKEEEGHGGDEFQSEEDETEFVDQSSQIKPSSSTGGQAFSSHENQSSPLNERLPSVHDHELSPQGAPTLKNESVSMFPNQGQSPPETRSSLQEELAALRSFKVPSKRTELTLQEKVDLLNHSEGKSQRQLAQMFGIGKSQVQTILKRRPEILKAYTQNCVSDRKRFGKRAENDDVNKFTWEWFQEMSNTQGIQVNGPMLQEQAKQFAKKLGRNDFKASNGWLSSFRKRHNIQSSEQGLSTQEPPKISSWKDNLKQTMSKYSYRDILCLTELHLNYTALPEKIKAACGKRKAENTDHSLTVMLWYNMLGEFDTPVVVGRHPWQAYCGVEETDIPLIWRWNLNAWVSADIFQEWVQALDRKFQQQGRHVLLILEHTSVHFLDLHLSHVKLVFHPSNSLEESPFNSDVIRRFKFCYQKQLLQYIVSQLGAQQENVLTIAASVSLLECCLWISQAVGQVYPSLVKRAFCKSLPDHVSLSDLEESDKNPATDSTDSEAHSVDEELEFQSLFEIVLSSLYSSIGSGLESRVRPDSGATAAASPGNGDSKVKRVELTLQEKVQLLRIHHHNGKSQRQLAKMFGIGKSQTHSILKRKDEILDQYENNANLARKRICRRAENDDVNRLTLEWFNEVTKLVDVPVTGPMVQEKAKRIAAELGRTDFKASNGWLDSFRKRNNIVFFFSKNASNSTSEDNLEEISVRLPSSACSSSIDSLKSRPGHHDLSKAAVHGKTVSPSELDILGNIKTEPEDVCEKQGCSESVSEPGSQRRRLPDSDSSDDDEHSDSDSDSDKSNTDAEGERNSSTKTPYTSISDTHRPEKPVKEEGSVVQRSSIEDFHRQDKPVKEEGSVVRRSSIEDFHRQEKPVREEGCVVQRSSIEDLHTASVMAGDLRMFCEDENLTQLSVMLDFIERQLQSKHSSTSHGPHPVL